MKYKTIVIDPPWDGVNATRVFKRGLSGRGVIVLPYTTMSGIQIASLRVAELAAPDAQLFIWTTSRSVGDAYLLLQGWKFNYRGILIWQKRLGLGRYVQHQAEFLLWGARQGARGPAPGKAIRQIYTWPRPKRHSEKPPEAYRFIRALSDAPRLDIFSRQHRPGFRGWGDEHGKLDAP